MNIEPPPDSEDEVIAKCEPFELDVSDDRAETNASMVTPADASSYQRLPIEALRLDRFQGGLLIAVVAVICLIGFVLLWFMSPPTIEVRGGAAVGCLLLLGLVVYPGWVYPKAAHQCASWRISEHGLEIRRGVWWRHRIVIPHSRMQHSDIEQGPLQRMYSLATLVIHTAGTKNSSIQLENLNSETAEQLRDALTGGRWDMNTPPELPVTT